MASEYSNLSERELTRRRATIKTKVTHFTKLVQNAEEYNKLDEAVLSAKIKLIEDEFKTYRAIQIALESIAKDEDYEKRVDEALVFEEAYTTALGLAQKIISERSTASSMPNELRTRSAGSVNSLHETHVKLPTMDLPKFSGSYEAWPGFCDAFRSAVDENPNLRDAQRLIYLRSCLTGKAAKKIESLETTGNDYAVAWNILQRYYDDPAAVINNRVKAFFELPSCSKQSAAVLGELVDAADKHYSALKALKKPFLEAFPMYAITSKLDEQTRLKWRERAKPNELPTMDELLEFLRTQRKVLESARPERKEWESRFNNRSTHNSHNRPRTETRVNKVVSYSAQLQPNCYFCKGPHFAYACNRFISASVARRLKMVKGAKLCGNCLRPHHSEENCRGGSCRRCSEKHHAMLHAESRTEDAIPSTTTSLNALVTSQILLPTALINILDRDGKPQPCKVLLDSGSQSHFITDKLAGRLGLEQKTVAVPVSGIKEAIAYVKNCVSATIGSRINSYSAKLTFLILPRVTGRSPTQPIHADAVRIPKKIRLADPYFNIPADIDAIIGAEVFYQLLCAGRKIIPRSSLVRQNTRLGWVIAGKTQIPGSQNKIICNASLRSLRSEIEQFWLVEEGPTEGPLSAEEIECERHYVKHTKRESSSGRYVVKLPFKDNVSSLGESYRQAVKRLERLEKSLQHDPETREQYAAFLAEYAELGHMSELANPSVEDCCYLAHHAVRKETSVTTKLRVVFDASARTSTGLSLNHTMMVGPVIQDDLFSIITRFRSHAYALTADISKMYRQILVDPADSVYQKILWCDDRDGRIKTYALNTVTYGTAAASFLATRTLKQLALDEGGSFPNATVALREDFYMDDLLTGAPTYAEAAKIRDELIGITGRGGFQLRQWAPNVPALIEDICDGSDSTHVRLDLSENIRTLGINWDARRDTLSYSVNPRKKSRATTKRTILSEIARLFDPLGLLGPVVIRAKLMMQTLWQLKSSWDERVPPEIHAAWVRFRDELPVLEDLRFLRNILADGSQEFELHGFCDASERAYGACIYARSKLADGTHSNTLVCAKSHVAPLKTQSLPRLELCGAVLLSRLYRTVITALRRVKFRYVTFWTDSTITLSWINTSPHTLETFVGHRVTEIQTITNSDQWRHVPSGQNPADLISRGMSPSEFLQNSFWRLGPDFLTSSTTQWPKLEIPSIEIPELRPVVSLVTTVEGCDLLKKYSSLARLKRIVTYCLRLRDKKGGEGRSKTITAPELQSALTRIVLLVQRECFAAEISDVGAGRGLKSSFAALSPFIDRDGILRVGGRLANAKLPYAQRHPALLPRDHPVTVLIIRSEHDRHYHAGTQATLNATREQFWIVNGNDAVKRVIKGCVTCARATPNATQYEMGNLPASRSQVARPFARTGVDYCGPIFIKETKHRNRARVKVYLAVFVCFVTKAVHIEVVSDLTTEAFLAAVRRFVARRGKCANMHSDNATTFVGADNELKNILNSDAHHDIVSRRLADEGIAWHFIPPRSPHFGGLWEAAVKSVKHHLTRVIGDTLLTFEGLLTLVTQIEAILNSCPLTPLSNDPNDLRVLTPGHFLIGDSLMSLPDKNFSETPPGRLSAWEHIQQMQQHFWNRWVREYLHTHTVRNKWHNGTVSDIKVGDIVIINEENTAPMRWPLGRISAVHPGADGIVRVVSVRTARGEYKRRSRHSR